LITPDDELTALLTLGKIKGLGPVRAKYLYEKVGNAKDIFRRHKELNNIITGVNQNLSEVLNDSGSLCAARQEISYLEKNNIIALTPEDAEYPQRLLQCNDAPLVLFTIGKVNLNSKHIIAVVGTRHATDYGKDLTCLLIKEIAETFSDTVIVSGLAYGIDIAAHKAAIDYGIPTVGVLAHGLDRIYPAAHREYAKEMLKCGGLVTEFWSGTFPEKFNFVQRNRIIAGLSDAIVVVQSADKGGSLITAEFAEMYSRECYAFPGNIGDKYSVGCNMLIRDNKAGLICSGTDLMYQIGWISDRGEEMQKANEKDLFGGLSGIEMSIMNILLEHREGIEVDSLAIKTDTQVKDLLSILFNMEMKGLVRPAPGAMYRPILK